MKNLRTAICYFICSLSVLALMLSSTEGSPSLAKQPRNEESSVQWRKTVNGWERADLWQVGRLASDTTDVAAPLPLPGLHPMLLAGLMFAAAGLLAVPTSGSDPQTRSVHSA